MNIICILVFFLTINLPAQDQEGKTEGPKINWITGPTTADLGDIGEVKIPKDFLFANGDDTRTLMKSMGNPVNNTELGTIIPRDGKWFIVFEFSDTGYVRDDERDSLDANAILESIREGSKTTNEWRRKNGFPELKLLGWEKKPHYDVKTNNLEWAPVFESQNGKVVNYNIRILGRRGVMEVTLVLGPEILETNLPHVRKILKNYAFKAGHRYAEYREGDKIAKYGLAALITGGAAAVAAKSGLLSKLWKFILAGILAVGAFFKKIFRAVFRGKDEDQYTAAVRKDEFEEET